MSDAKDFVEDEWLLQNMRMQKTFSFFVRAEGEDGNDYFFNNGENLYKITFTCDDADGIDPLTPFRGNDGEDIYNLSGQMVNGSPRLQSRLGAKASEKLSDGKLPRGLYIVGGRKVLVK